MANKFKAVMVDQSYTDDKAVPPWVVEALERENIEFVYRLCETRAELEACAADADLVWVHGGGKVCSDANIDVLEKCGAIIRTGSGTDNIGVAEATRRGIIVANTPYGLTDEVADHTIGLVFAVIRLIPLLDRTLRTGKWDRMNGAHRWHLTGQTLGLVGFGMIPQRVAKKMAGFDMNIIAFDPYARDEAFQKLNVRRVGFDEVFAQSDYVSVHCPLIPETHHSIGEKQLRSMKKNAVLINTARGPIVDEAALIRALKEGWISAAGLDVFEQEPISTDNPLLKLDNAVLTPHIASNSDILVDTMWKAALETVIGFSKGRWPKSWVNRNVKPRWELK